MDLDEKLDSRESDIDMKEDPSLPKDGDVSQINQSISNIAEPLSSKSLKRAEPTFELHPNFSQVTPAQVAHISFQSVSHCQPVRPVSGLASIGEGKVGLQTAPTGTAYEKYASGGGIIILADLRPDEEAEFIEFEPPAVATVSEPVAIASGPTLATALSGPHIASDESAPEADLPGALEVRHLEHN
ncbi:hypothetical protein H0H81_004192 [Sphagnurus paluster]|uniref:Uncharacterized protein n=1 Tax=Sphagnurus paluster TaxID=117069 RepID=A0A9P7FSA6_9AGAR|nr:hypothetical protein H0H81_004192 [Sphagnurus paluster]